VERVERNTVGSVPRENEHKYLWQGRSQKFTRETRERSHRGWQRPAAVANFAARGFTNLPSALTSDRYACKTFLHWLLPECAEKKDGLNGKTTGKGWGPHRRFAAGTKKKKGLKTPWNSTARTSLAKQSFVKHGLGTAQKLANNWGSTLACGRKGSRKILIKDDSKKKGGKKVEQSAYERVAKKRITKTHHNKRA